MANQSYDAAKSAAQQGTSYRQPSGIAKGFRGLWESLVGGPRLTQDDLFKEYKTWKIMDQEWRNSATAGAYSAKNPGTFVDYVQTKGRVDPTTLQSFMAYMDKWGLR